MNRVLMLRYHEIALKGFNRGWFEDKLMKNIARLLSQSRNETPIGGTPKITREHGRILLHSFDPEATPAVKQVLSRVFGLTGYSEARLAETTMAAITEAALDEFRAYIAKSGLPASFRVKTRRSEKVLPLTSTQIDGEVGGTIQDAFPGLKVNLAEPAFTIGIEIRAGKSFIWTRGVSGPGGLPVGTNARVLALMSGGLDSPVAAIKALKRGSPVSFIHFYGAPFVGEDVLHKVEDLVRIVNRYQPDPKSLIVVPFGKIQEQIALATNSKLRTVLYRRMMVKVACEIARDLGARALVTGESLGQVASQTVENMATIDRVADLPILRPLVTYDKEEIIQEARLLGTFETSIRPGVDCCTLFADRHPSIRSNHHIAEEQELKFPMAAMVREAVESARF